MKKVFSSLVLAVFMICLSVASVWAEIPNLIKFQGRVTNSAGAPLNGNYNITFRVYDAETAGTLLWNETQTTVPVSNGIFTVFLGNVISLNLPFDIPYWLAMEINTDGEMTPRQAITSVGYAYRSKVADSVANASMVPQGAIIMWRGAGCPTGYSRVTELDGKFLTGGSAYNAVAGGSNTDNNGGNTGSHSLTTAEMPNHFHNSGFTDTGYYGIDSGPSHATSSGSDGGNLFDRTSTTGSGSGHNHTIASSDNRPEFASILLCEKN